MKKKTPKNSTPSPKVSRNFFVRLYPDCPDHMIAFERLCKSPEYSVAWITHDSDVLEDGSPAKPHIHMVAMMDTEKGTTRSIDRFVALFCEGLAEFNSDDVEIIGRRNKALRYLIHRDDPEKFQYAGDCVQFGDFAARSAFETALKAKEKDDESEEMAQLVEWIITSEELLSFAQVTQYALDNGFWAAYRRSFAVIRELVREHNYGMDN